MTHRTPTNVPAESGDGAPALATGTQADPTPAIHPDASAVDSPRDGDRAGAGRPTSLVRIPPMSADLAQALIDADAEQWRVDTTLRNLGVLVFAVEFEDRVRNGGGAA